MAQAGQQEKIISYLESELQKQPKNENLLRLTGFHYLRINNLLLGEKYYREALAVNPACARCYLNIGRIYAVNHDFQQALNYLNRAVETDPNDHLAYLNRAEVYYELENMDASCQDYEMAKTIVRNAKTADPTLLKHIEESMLDFCDDSKASYYYQRGVAFYNLKQFEKAMEYYTAGLQKFPENSMLLSFKGNTYLALKDYKSASVHYGRSLANKANLLIELQKNPRFANANKQDLQSFFDATLASNYYNDAECKFYTESINEALASMDQAIALAPDLSDFHKEDYYNRRGQIYMAKHQYELALTDFNQSLKINENLAGAYINRAVARIGLAAPLKTSNTIIYTRLPHQPFRVNQTLKSKISIPNEEPNMVAALADCNKGIELDKHVGYSYYVRGQVKQFLGHTDYRIDLLKAKQLGVDIEAKK